MVSKISVIFLLVILFGLGSDFVNSLALAKSPQEECEDVKAKIPDVSCKVCGDCAVVILRMGEKICKQCNELQCDMVECNKCSDSECATL